MSTSSPSLGQEIYSDVAGFGRIWSLIVAIIATLIGIVMIVFGFVILFKKTPPKKKVIGTVVSVNPPTITVSYNIGNGKFQKTLSYSGAPFNIGQQINIYYDPNNPNDSALNPPIPRYVGAILIIIGILVSGFAWLWVYLARKYKAVAAAEAISGGISLIRSI